MNTSLIDHINFSKNQLLLEIYFEILQTINKNFNSDTKLTIEINHIQRSDDINNKYLSKDYDYLNKSLCQIFNHNI